MGLLIALCSSLNLPRTRVEGEHRSRADWADQFDSSSAVEEEKLLELLIWFKQSLPGFRVPLAMCLWICQEFWLKVLRQLLKFQYFPIWRTRHRHLVGISTTFRHILKIAHLRLIFSPETLLQKRVNQDKMGFPTKQGSSKKFPGGGSRPRGRMTWATVEASARKKACY